MVVLIAQKVCLALKRDALVVIHLESGMILRSLPLRVHRRLVPLNIQTQPSLASNIIGQINGESISIVKLEDHVARDGLVGNLLQRLLKNGHTVVECPGKLRFLALQG